VLESEWAVRLGLERMGLRRMSYGRIRSDKGWAKKPQRRRVSAWITFPFF